MDIVTVAIYLIVIGVLLWAVNEFIPMQAGIKKMLNVVVIVLVLIWLLRVLGVVQYVPNISMGG